MPSLSNPPTIVLVSSHRAREKLHLAIGKTQGYYSWDRKGSWYECSQELLEEVLKIKGIKRAKWKDDLKPYIDW